MVAGVKTGTGTNDNDVVIELTRADPFRFFQLQSTAGAMDVVVSFDGTNFSTAPLSLFDQGATTNLPVLVTAADRTYQFSVERAHTIRVLQNGATAVEDATLSYSTGD